MALAGIGIAGCGRMGGGMLAALVDAGFDVQGFDLRPAAEFGPLAKVMARNGTEFAAPLQTLITVVRDVAQTEDVLFGAQNFTATAPNLRRIIISSTLSPAYIRGLRARIPARIALIDAPMSGAEIAARERRLSFMLGGEASEIARIQPLLAAMGTSFHAMGRFGNGMAAKVLNNLLAASNTVMTRLVLDWAAQQGLDRNDLLALIAASSGQNWFASGFHEIEFSKNGYAPENTIGILKKDVLSALDDAPKGADTRLPDLLVALISTLPADPYDGD